VRTSLLLGVGRFMIPVPRVLWWRLMRANGRKIRASLRFMTAEHQRVRDFVVTELPRREEPLTPESIAATLRLPVARVGVVLDELERRLTFLFRSRGTAVTWAYPVTIDETPHHAAFSSGEEAYSP
jgi:hypothetical protein